MILNQTYNTTLRNNQEHSLEIQDLYLMKITSILIMKSYGKNKSSKTQRTKINVILKKWRNTKIRSYVMGKKCALKNTRFLKISQEMKS